MDGYQPPLLSLQDMLNLSDNEDENESWSSSNPYNISNFFEPIVTVTKTEDSEDSIGISTATKEPQLGNRSSYSDTPFVNPFEDFELDNQQHFVEPPIVPTEVLNICSIKRELVSNSEDPARGDDVSYESEPSFQNDSKEDSFLDLDMFDEEMVTSELHEADLSSPKIGVTAIKTEIVTQNDAPGNRIPAISPPKSKTDRVPACSTTVKNKPVPGTPKGNVFSAPLPKPARPSTSKGPTLTEVKFDALTREELREKFKRDREKKCKKAAIGQLNLLINTLKLYRNQLQDFLKNEGDIILEQYNAKTLLKGILPDINESSKQNQANPFYEAYAIKTAVTSHVIGRTYLSTIPRRRPYLWRGSDLLLLQKTILESAIHQREFFLDCRYTDLLTEMGFDTEDLERLKKCPTKEVEQGTMKIILNEHNFFSKLKASHKQPIQTMIIKRNGNSAVPRVHILPNPEKLVVDKWNSLQEIRQRTILSDIEDKDINWLYVLKNITDINPKLNCVDENICKLTFDHLLSHKYNNLPWHIHELQKLQEIRKSNPNISWAKAAELLGTKRSGFTSYVKYKAHCPFRDNSNLSLSLPNWTLNHVRHLFDECKGNAFKVDFMLSRVLKKHYSWIKPSRLLAFAQHSINPRLRKGKFTDAEDAILLIVMEKYKEHFLETNGSMDPIGYALPWRHTSIWKFRMGRLFSRFYYKMWSLEDDQLLWSLVEKYGPNYKIINRHFPHKDRKQCRGRYAYLQKIFQTTALEDYHLIYNSKRGIDLSRLDNLSRYLELTIRSKLSGSSKYVRQIDLEFLKLRRKPTEFSLESYLMTFPICFMQAALDRLLDFKAQISAKWAELSSRPDMATEFGKTAACGNYSGFDRRKFDPKCPVSIASALHFQGAKLLDQETIFDLTDFEAEIYSAYKYFSVRGTAKKTACRRMIPTLDTLRKLHSVSRITEQPISAYKPGQPSVIVTIKSEVPDEQEKERQNEEVLRELEEKKKGGRRKGSVRKGTKIKEARKRAAMLRWQNQKERDNEVQLDGNDSATKENIPNDGDDDMANSPFWEVSSPCTPATPGSIASTVESESVTGTGPSMRKAIVGMISDHAYIHPMEGPGELHTLSLPQLFAKMGGAKGKSTGLNNK